ncbi:TRAP transporter substrate-binding protein [Actinophytocola sp.]|uniref:TRAP transporter substrate-binding protein n=1 Tax=Actinophytocola sp. TaxID=1872138 RepID=UPI003D6B6BA3
MTTQLARRRIAGLLACVSITAMVATACSGATPTRDSSGSGGDGQAVTLRLASALPDTDSTTVALKEAAKTIHDETQGRVTLQIFPNGQLGTVSGTFDQLRSGSVDMIIQNPSNTAALLPEVGVFAAPYLFSSNEGAYQAWQSDAGQQIVADFKNKLGLVAFPPWNFGTWQIYTARKAVNSCADMKGLKMRVPPSPILSKFLSGCGANPVQMDVSQAFLGLQTGSVSGLPLPLNTITGFNFQQLVTDASMVNFLHDVINPIISQKSWDKVSEEDQKVFTDAMEQARNANNDLLAEAETTARQKLLDAGVEIQEHPDITQFKQAAERTIESFVDQWGGQERIDALREAGNAS